MKGGLGGTHKNTRPVVQKGKTNRWGKPILGTLFSKRTEKGKIESRGTTCLGGQGSQMSVQ